MDGVYGLRWAAEINLGGRSVKRRVENPLLLPSCSQRGHRPPTLSEVPPPMAKRLLSRARLIALDRSILPPALTRFLSGDPPAPITSTPEDKGKKAAAAAATAVVMEARAKSRREDAAVGSREGSEEDDEDAGLHWTSWRPDVAWLSKALEPALHLCKQYNWKPFTCSSPALLTPPFHFIILYYLCALRISIVPCSPFKLGRMHLSC